MHEQKDMYIIVVHRAPYFILVSAITLAYTTLKLKRSIHIIEKIGSALSVARTESIKELNEYGFDYDDDYALLIDDDILIENSYDDLSKIFNEAEQKGINIIGDYADAHGNSVHRLVENDKVIRLPKKEQNNDYLSMEKFNCGLGFYYGRIPKDYVFRMDKMGEDYNFFNDNQQLHANTHLDFRIKLAHYKSAYVKRNDNDKC